MMPVQVWRQNVHPGVKIDQPGSANPHPQDAAALQSTLGDDGFNRANDFINHIQGWLIHLKVLNLVMNNFAQQI